MSTSVFEERDARTAAATALNILVHVERLGPTYDTGWIHFSLNVTAALTGDQISVNEVKDFLSLWKWSWSSLAILGIDSTNKTVLLPPGSIDVLLTQAPTTTPLIARALDSELNHVIQLDPSLSSFICELQKPSERRTIDEKRRNWKAFLAHASTFPAPLPQGQDVKLCVFFRVKAETIGTLGVRDLVAAPIFDGDPFGNRHPQMPSGAPWDVTQKNPLRLVAASDISPAHYEWDYDAGPPFITASLNQAPVAVEPSNPSSFLDLQTLWVNKPAPIFPEDWTVRLEGLLADAFDMPRRLLDALQDNLQTLRERKVLAWTVDETFHLAFMASLRDMANLGLAAPPEHRSLAETLIGDLSDSESAIKLLRTFQQTYYATAADWIGRLKAFLDRIEPIEPFPTVPKAEAVAEYARTLERLYTALADETNLRQLTLDEWQRALESTDFWTRNQQLIGARLGNLQLRKRMALGNVGVGWKQLTGDLHDVNALVATVQDTFERYLRGRFVNPPRDGYDDYLPRTVNVPLQALDHLRAYADTFVRAAVLPRDPGAEPDDPGSVREDLVMQVDRLQREGDDGSRDDHDDYLRRISGLGVLLRRQGAGGTGWHCLSLADVEVLGQDAGLDPVPVPLRLGYRNGLRSSYLAYANQPMAARSPSARLSDRNRLLPSKDGRISANRVQHRDASLVGYANPYSSQQGPRLEGLVYGETYDAAIFLIGNAGNVPPLLSATDPLGRAIPWKAQMPASDPPFQSIPYKRRVPVGHLRLFSAGATPGQIQEMDRLPVPPIPDTVLPLARSLHVVDVDNQHKDREHPLILLAPDDGFWQPKRNAFSFNVRPPSVPIEVWDRWISKDRSVPVRTRREQVWTHFHQRADVAQDGGTKASSPDVSMDDPAVVALEFTLTRVYPQPGTPHVLAVPFGAASPQCDDGLACVQAPPIAVTIRSADILQLPASSTSPVSIGLPPGEIWRIDMRPVVSDASRFLDQTISGGRSVTLIAEIADRLFKTTDEELDVRRRLNLALTPAFASDALNVTLTLPETSDRFRDRIHRVELLLQRWRWDGRPISHFDRDTGGDPLVRYGFPFDRTTDDLEACDGTLFASRESSDHLVVPARVDFATPNAQASPALFRTDLSMQSGALYFRTGLRVFSRYEGLLLKNDSIDSRTAPSSQSAEKWKRIVVPCRWNKPVPRPALKLVLPLTQASPASLLSATTTAFAQPGGDTDDAMSGAMVPSASVTPRASAPGLLVVLDESWYADTLGGVAETFEWDIARAALPDVPGDSRLQFGPDPILDLTDDPLAGRAVVGHQAIGAIGYTNDSGTEAPLFTRASFVIPPPEIEGIADLSWYFLKLRFRRSLNGVEAALARHSSWTEPVWCQLLPPSNCIRVGETLLSTSMLGFQPLKGTFIDVRTGNIVNPQGTPTAENSHSEFRLWALLTRPVVDALGRASQEAFDKLVPVAELAKLAPIPGEAIVRLVEIQQRQGDTIGDWTALRDALFPSNDTDGDAQDARARVVRMTPPVVNRPPGA